MSNQGVFLRGEIGQLPGTNKTAWTVSPDILVLGVTPLPDPSTPVSGYNTGFPSTLYANTANFIYVRGLNTLSSTITVRIWLWALLSINNERFQGALGISYGSTDSNYAEVTVGPNEVFVTNPPFVIIPNATEYNYAFLAIVENPPLSNPPQMAIPGSFNQPVNVIEQLVCTDSTMALNSLPVAATPPTLVIENITPVTGVASTTQYIGVQCYDMPTDAFFSYCLPGPDAASTLIVAETPITTPNLVFLLPVTWPVDFTSQLVISGFAGATPLPPDAAIYPIVMPATSSAATPAC